MAFKKPKLNSQVKHSKIKDEGLIIVQDAGEVHIVNEVAAFLLPYINGENSLEDLADIVIETFEVDREIAVSDIEHFLKDLEMKKVIIYV